MASDATDAFYNVGTGQRTSIKELAELVLDVTDSSLSIQYEESGQTFVTNRVGCPKKAEEGLGFKAKVELKEGLRNLIEWRNSHKLEVERRRQEAGIQDE
jgi:UDP-glucose 4-epimerase